MDIRKKQIFLLSCAFLLPAVFLLLFSPFSSARLDKKHTDKMIMAHPSRLWALNPGYDDGHIRINSKGCRGAEPDKRELLLLLGDEHIFSENKSEKETFAWFLEQSLQKVNCNIQVMNGGVPFYSIAQMLSWAEEKAIKPDYACITYSVHDQDPADITDSEYIGSYLAQDIKRFLWGGYISRSFISGRIEYNYDDFCKMREQKGSTRRVPVTDQRRCMKLISELFRSEGCKGIFFLHLPSAAPRFEKIHAQDYESLKEHRKNAALDLSLDEAELRFVDFADEFGYLCDLHEIWHNDGRIKDESLAGSVELTAKGCEAAAGDFVKEIIRRKLISPIQK